MQHVILVIIQIIGVFLASVFGLSCWLDVARCKDSDEAHVLCFGIGMAMAFSGVFF